MNASAARVLLLSAVAVGAGAVGGSETVLVRQGPLNLHALVWRPPGRGPFPAVLFNHGSGRSREELQRLGPYEAQAEAVGPVFAGHGYLLLYLFRRGVGLSADLGPSAVERMNAELAARGQEARNAAQMEMLEGDEMQDALAGLEYLRHRPEVDARRLALVGHSLGGSLTLLMAEREPCLRAAVVFAAAGYSWERSSELRSRLRTAAARAPAPIFFIHAANDYSVEPGRGLDEERARVGKPHQLRIYPPAGDTAEAGHSFLYNSIGVWERDVFAFLDAAVRPDGVAPPSR